MSKIPFPQLIDNSALSSFKKCPYDWSESHLRMIGPKGGNVHLHAGGAFAAGLEATRKAFYTLGKDEYSSIAEGLRALTLFYGDFEPDEGSAKSWDRMFLALIEYFTQYPLATDVFQPYATATGHAIEFSFAIPLDILHPETGNPILYGGRFDMLAQRDGVLFVEDDKTASQLGSQWMRNWDLDSQFTGYCYAAKTFGYPVAGAVIRGISLLKSGYGHAQAIVYRPQWKIDQWLETTQHQIRMMIAYWEQNFYPKTLDKHACNSYGGCGFTKLCDSPSPDSWRDMYYEPRVWNPLSKGA